ncbi:type I polyketide synthase [Catellatospora chokoriensis]|uniref:type I polyketide synthase n=1 Tax=Catellatospora chokoriensis TaxID=310353 RepID=UPI0031E3E31F
MANSQPVAIIGMAGRFPGADGIDRFWQNIADRQQSLTTISDDELLEWGEDPGNLNNPLYVRRRPLLEDAGAFDARCFGMTPREAEIRDPQYRLMLEVVHAALDHAGYDPTRYEGGIGVYAGSNVNRYRYDYVEQHPDLIRTVGLLAVDIANAPDYLSTFISYKLGLRGPAMTVLTACSSSLVAVHLACAALSNGDSDIAVAGGVDIEFPFHRGYQFLPGGITADDGTPRPFDEHATGTNFGNGAGAVVLKPLAAALADGDTVYSVIRGTAVNNDGDRKAGFSAPSVAGQSECIQAALRAADVDPRTITLVEAHGTATPVGDPIELTGLTDAFRTVAGGDLTPGSCAIGSVKSNIGHLGQAAGIAGLIKATLALHHRTIPASINFTTPNPAVDWSTSPFSVATRTRPWTVPDGQPRRASVSSFGIGGTNAHAVLEEAPAPTEPACTAEPPVRELVIWSAADETAADALRERLADHFAGFGDVHGDQAEPAPRRFGDAANTLRIGRTARRVRGAVVAVDAADAAGALRDPGRIVQSDGVHRQLVFGFPGQGAQQPGALADLYRDERTFRAGCDASFDVLEPLLGTDLRQLWLNGNPAELAETEVAQPLLYTIEYTLAHCLMRWGVEPSMLFGHSLGELVAAGVAGVLDFESGLRAVAGRAKAMARMPRGRMIAVAAAVEELADLQTDGVGVAAVNGARQTVLSGPVEAVAAVEAELGRRKVATRALRTSHGFHSASMADAAVEFEQLLSTLPLNTPEVPVISALTGEPVTAEEARSPRFWARQLVEPVLLDRVVGTVLAAGPSTVVEVGPGRTLAALLRGRPDMRATNSRSLPTTSPGAGTTHLLDELFAEVWVAGGNIAGWRDPAERQYRRTAVPGYPYQRRHYWLDRASAHEPRSPATPTPATPTPAARAVADEDLAVAPTRAELSPPSGQSWSLSTLEWIRDRDGSSSGTYVSLPLGVALVVASERNRARLQAAFGRAGYRTVVAVPGEFDPNDATAWRRLLERLDQAGTRPDVVAHALLLDAAPGADSSALEQDLDSAVYSLYAGVRACAEWQRRHRHTPTLVVLGRHQVDVTGSEPLNPAAAGAQALLRSVARELPGVTAACLDVSDNTPEDVLAGELRVLGDPLVALRGATRWLPRLRRLPAVASGSRPQLRRHGVHLITGGLRGIGLVTARALVDTGLRPRLGLLGRSLPDPATTDGQRLRDELEAFAAAGAEVELLIADVTEVASLTEAVDRLEARFGRVNGVFHSAGVPGGGLAERRAPSDIRAVLAPKTLGVLRLEEVFAKRPELDFLILYSSQAALAGLYGSADYAAANAFLDAHARNQVGAERATVSVQWPGWSEVGMATRSNVGLAALTGARVAAETAPSTAAPGGTDEPDGATDPRTVLTRRYAPGSSWELDEHVFEGNPVLPGTALLELAVLAGRQKLGESDLIELRDVVFLAPVVGATEIRVLAEDIAGSLRFHIQGRGMVASGEWTEHAAGTITTAKAVTGTDVAALWAELPMLEYDGLAGWIDFGTRWPEVSRSHGDGVQRIAEFALREEFHAELAEHPLHPAVVDAASGVLTDIERGRSYAPFLYRRVTVLKPLSPRVTVHARLTTDQGTKPRPTDFDLYDTDTGELLVRLSGFTLREVKGGMFGTGATPTPPAAGPANPIAVEPDERAPGLLNPRTGSEVLLTLLAGGLPPVVSVDPAGSRLQVEGMPWLDEPAYAPAPAGAEAPPPASPAPMESAAAVAAPRPTSAVPATRNPVPETDESAGGGSVVEVLGSLWTAALGVTDIGPDEDFFDVGGNSLAAVALIDLINRRFGVGLGAGAMFEFPTIRLLAGAIEG